MAALLALAPAAAHADLHDAVNWARLRGCAAPAVRAPLRDNGKLREAALRIANGASLHAALAAVGFPAAEASAVHLSGAINDDQVAHLLAGGYCATLVDPKLSDLGATRRGREVWMVLAASAPVPSMGDATLIGRQIWELVNAARAGGRRCGEKYFGPVPALRVNPALTAAALEHSRDMAKYQGFDHRGHAGSTPAERVQHAGYGSYRIVGENIAAGAMTPTEVMQGWLASPQHCENIMDARFTEIGIAFAVNPASSEMVYWTQNFAAPPAAAPR
jgi:uncharacterized protein YkwD